VKKMYSSRNKIFSIFTIILILPFFFAGCSKPKEPKLSLSEDSWYYGEVKPDQVVSHQFTLKNEGEGKLTIDSFYSSCACVILEMDKKEIAPGGEGTLKAIFDPYGYEGFVTKEVTINSNDPEHPKKIINLSITVLRVPHPDIKLSQQTFDLGTVTTSEQSVLKFTISNEGDADLIIEDIVTEEIFSHNLALPLILLPGEQYLSEVYIDTSQIKEEVFRKAIRIMTNDPQNSMVFLRITGTTNK